MSRDIPIARREVQIEDAFGLRMKTAAEFVCLAGRFRADVWIIHEGRRYNGRSMRDLLNIGTECGSRLELEAQGPMPRKRSRPWPRRSGRLRWRRPRIGIHDGAEALLEDSARIAVGDPASSVSPRPASRS